MTNQIYQNIIQEFEQLNFNDKLDLIADLIQLIKQERKTSNKKLFAESKAEIRLKDELISNRWITVISEGEEINEQELINWVNHRV